MALFQRRIGNKHITLSGLFLVLQNAFREVFLLRYLAETEKQ